MMSLIDKLLERRARVAAQTASRRGLLKTFGAFSWALPQYRYYPSHGQKAARHGLLRKAAIPTVTIGDTVQSTAFYAAAVGGVLTLARPVPRCRP